MVKRHTLALGLLLSAGILGGSLLLAKDEPAKVTSKTTKSATSVKTDVNTVIDVKDSSLTTEELNVRYIDVFGAMRESKEGIEAAQKLEVNREELAKSIEAVRAKYEQAMNEFKAKAATMNETARAKKEQELAKIKRDYENALQSGEEEMKLVMQEVTEVLAREVEQAVTELAKKSGWDAVVDKVSGRVIYTSRKADSTAEVVKSMDKHYSYKLAHNEKSAAQVVTVASTTKKSSATTAA